MIILLVNVHSQPELQGALYREKILLLHQCAYAAIFAENTLYMSVLHASWHFVTAPDNCQFCTCNVGTHIYMYASIAVAKLAVVTCYKMPAIYI